MPQFCHVQVRCEHLVKKDNGQLMHTMVNVNVISTVTVVADVVQ